ncbi:MAG: glycosyltransferase [Phycisphaerales bacterium]
MSPDRTHGPMVLVPSLDAFEPAPGRVVLTKKFVEGVAEYASRWPGPVRVLIARTPAPTSNLDNHDYRLDELPFTLHWRPDNDAALIDAVRDAALIAPALYFRDLAWPAIGRTLDIPVVYTSEYSLRTRLQIVSTETANPLLRARRSLWNRSLERRYTDAVRRADGIQCNGTPTFEAYRSISPRPLLFFDTRVTRDMLISPDHLAARLAHLRAGGPIRLAFSGRLAPMKGADDLPSVAEHLARQGLSFTLDICGGGPLEASMRAHVERAGLASRVRFRGVLDFSSQLVPFIRSDIDLFICCHRQGDPSCTYLETMSCGVPIAGYDNEAFVGVQAASSAGWASPMNDPAALARLVARLAARRDEIAEHAARSLAFAHDHTFERTMQARVDHLLECARRPSPANA